jgi:hypothetical protein
MVASACLTLALMHLLMWLKRRQPLTSIIALTAQVFDRQGKFAMGYRVIREHMTQLAEVTVTR